MASAEVVKCPSVTLMHCISISPIYGYNVNVLPNAAHPVVDRVSKKLSGGLYKQAYMNQSCWKYGRYESSWCSFCCHTRGRWTLFVGCGNISQLCLQPCISTLFTCNLIPSSHAWTVFRPFLGTTEHSQVLGQCVLPEKPFSISSDEKTTE